MAVTYRELWTVAKPWLDTHCILGEGHFYEEETHSLRFVDVKKRQLHTVSLVDGSPLRPLIQLDTVLTVTSDIEGIDPYHKILIGVKYGIAILDRQSGSYEMVAYFRQPSNERLRSNDGAADPNGRFWLGSMTDFEQGEFLYEGSLWCFSASNAEEIERGINTPNSIGWSPDNKTLYWTHSRKRQVLARDYDSATGVTSNQRIFYNHQGNGEPDGFRIDVEGNIWQAIYGESRVLKICPNGSVVGEIRLPTRYITCVEFVGTELLITSAADEDGNDERSIRYGGSIFRVDVGIAGVPLFKYKM